MFLIFARYWGDGLKVGCWESGCQDGSLAYSHTVRAEEIESKRQPPCLRLLYLVSEQGTLAHHNALPGAEVCV